MKSFHRTAWLILTLSLSLLLSACGQAAPASSSSADLSSTSTGDTSGSSSANDTDDAAMPAQFLIETKARFAESDDPAWQTTLEAHNGETIEVQLQYVNTDTATHDDVNFSVDLDSGLTYVEGSTKLYNTKYPNGATVDQDDIITDEGIYLGSYIGRQEGEEQGANLYVRFSVSVNHDAQPGTHTLRIFAHARRADQTEPTSEVADFYLTTPLVSMP